MTTTFLLSFFTFTFFVLSADAGFVVQSSCSGVFPVVDTSGPGCSVPAFVDQDEFGDNLNSRGQLIFRKLRRGTSVRIDVSGLSRPDLVLTAWIIWADPSQDLPDVFNVASHVSPVAPSTGAFTGGLGREANRLRYKNRQRATLRTVLDFDFTKPNSGPLVGARPSFQSDIPGIQETPFRQFNATADGRAIPIAGNFLRVFDPETGFQKLDSRGRPELVRAPTTALGIAVVAHTDKTTHGVVPGFLDTDHFEVVFFDLANPRRG